MSLLFASQSVFNSIFSILFAFLFCRYTLHCKYLEEEEEREEEISNNNNRNKKKDDEKELEVGMTKVFSFLVFSSHALSFFPFFFSFSLVSLSPPLFTTYSF